MITLLLYTSHLSYAKNLHEEINPLPSSSLSPPPREACARPRRENQSNNQASKTQRAQESFWNLIVSSSGSQQQGKSKLRLFTYYTICICMCVCVDSRGRKRNVEIFIDSVLERKRKKGLGEREREKQGHRVSLLGRKRGRKRMV